MQQTIIEYFKKYLLLESNEMQLIESKGIKRNIKRRQLILKEGEVCKQYTYVVEGCFKMYGVDDKGYQHNIQFAAEGDWITDIGSFHSLKPSKLYIEAIEASSIIQFEQKDLYFLYLNIPELDRIFKVIIENKFVELQNRVLQTFSSTAQQRYLSFLEQYSYITNRLPNTQIASYLGITPEFLSMIRRELAGK